MPITTQRPATKPGNKAPADHLSERLREWDREIRALERDIREHPQAAGEIMAAAGAAIHITRGGKLSLKSGGKRQNITLRESVEWFAGAGPQMDHSTNTLAMVRWLKLVASKL
jgi:hypothetical protein